MTVPTAAQKRMVIVGATGMVGGYVLGYALEHPTVREISNGSRLSPTLYFPARIYLPCRAAEGTEFQLPTKCAASIVLHVLFPNQAIRADDLARAMVDVAVQKGGERQRLVLEDRDIRAISSRITFQLRCGRLHRRRARNNRVNTRFTIVRESADSADLDID